VSGPVRIIVADDQQVVRQGFAALLATQADFAVVGTASDGAEAVRLSTEARPDVVLMDIRMPGVDGIAATRTLTAAAGHRPRILILTTFDLDQYVYEALRAGASGFLLKDATAERLFEAVRVVAAGEGLLAPTVTRALISEFVRLDPLEAPAGEDPGPVTADTAVAAVAAVAGITAPATSADGRRPDLSGLTPRETQVLRLVAQGMSNAEIAGAMVVTEETVKSHVSRVLAKLGLRDRTQAVVAAYESGLVVPGVQDAC
jgi:DNA-binding NarL/FixJ family response regulator